MDYDDLNVLLESNSSIGNARIESDNGITNRICESELQPNNYYSFRVAYLIFTKTRDVSQERAYINI